MSAVTGDIALTFTRFRDIYNLKCVVLPVFMIMKRLWGKFIKLYLHFNLLMILLSGEIHPGPSSRWSGMPINPSK